MRRRLLLVPLLLLVAASGLAACGDDDDDPVAADAADAAVTIAGFAFDPDPLEVAAGTVVTVTNDDAAPHTWTADDGSFDSGRLGQGDTFEHTFDAAGQIAVHCEIHPTMKGTVTVT